MTGPYCAQCGQHAHVETPTLGEFVHEYLHHYVALEGKLGRSLWLLISRPGKLTQEYLAGRRARYVKPLQLYLTFSFIFFICLTQFGIHVGRVPGAAVTLSPVAPHASVQRGGSHPPQASAVKSAAGSTAGASAGTAASIKPPEGKQSNWKMNFDDSVPGSIGQHWNAGARVWQAQFDADPDKAFDKLIRQVLRYAPYSVFLLMPVFALLLQLLYWKRRLRYGAHLVYALHLHTLAFIVYLFAFLPLPKLLPILALLIMPVYFLLSLRRVYGGSVPGLVLRAGLLGTVYSILGGMTIVGIVFLTLGLG
ncbi:MAG TPA: DUF3667 domain-containing protein [Burkholderiaceae bacterium]